MAIQTDWRYSEERMDLRQKCLMILLSGFGSDLKENGEPKYSNQSMYECAHDWVSQGNVNTSGLTQCYLEHYSNV